MSDQESSEKASFAPEAYIIAGLGLAIMNLEAESAKTLTNEQSFRDLFEEFYKFKVSEDVMRRVVDMMHKIEVIKVDDDEFAGRYISLQKTTFLSDFKALAEAAPGSPLDVVLRGRGPWIDRVYENKDFWKQLEGAHDGADADASVRTNEDINPPEKTITLLDGSPERKELEAGLAQISEELRTNNSIAAELGDDRERIAAEVTATEAGIKSEKIRIGFLKGSALKVLRELSSKLKEKAIDLGVDKLIMLLEKILDSLA